VAVVGKLKKIEKRQLYIKGEKIHKPIKNRLYKIENKQKRILKKT